MAGKALNPTEVDRGPNQSRSAGHGPANSGVPDGVSQGTASNDASPSNAADENADIEASDQGRDRMPPEREIPPGAPSTNLPL